MYLGWIAFLTVLLAAAFYPAVRTLDLTSAWWALVAAVPLLLVTSQTAVRLVNWGVTHLVPPRPLPRMDFSAGIPDAHRTAVVVPTMLTSQNNVRQLVRDLELRHLANRDPNLRFVLLTDFPDAASEELPTDQPLLEAAESGLRELNARYTAPDQEVFLLLHRPRLWNPAEREWMGYERKRGKLADFNRLLLTGQTDRFSVIIGNAQRLEGVRYVITLDTDTQLPAQAAWKMVGALAHPLNRPVINPATQCVERGYGVIQPRMANSLVGAGRSRFAKLFAGEVGLDPYTREVSNTCHDMFGRGQFIGKGIYDVAAFHAAVGERFPEDTILSHDLIEGCHARCGFLNDVELIEDHPVRFLADVNRRLRWIRGDWQIAAWLGRYVPAGLGRRQRNPLDLLSRWLILDNLRRSLVPAAFLAALVCAWLLPGCDALVATAALLGLWFLPQAVRVICSVPRPPKHLLFRAHWADLSRREGRQFLVELIELGSVPYIALRSLGAIARVYWRKCISHRRLLEWQTAHDAERGTRQGSGRAGTGPAASVTSAAGPTGLSARPRQANLGVLRAFHRTGPELAAPRQLPGISGGAAGGAHLADEYRLVSAEHGGGVGLRLPLGAGHRAATGAYAARPGGLAAVSWSFPQLVQHARPAATAPILRLHRGQRQPGGAPHCAARRAAGTGHRAGSSRALAGRPGGHSRTSGARV
ncbi:MAG: hypothetical protein NTW87_27045, partial [Planctomycetota bacterium]|nr:hypothetical protein [Planctomycetota bacterium]